jgi:transposase
VERWIIAALRHRDFFSFHELNQTIYELAERLNNKPFQKLEGSRWSLFEATDKPALRPLPQIPYEFAEWKLCRVHIDYHIEVLKVFYSVPYSLVGQQVHVRITLGTVEIFFKGKRVASHARAFTPGQARTEPLHRPKSHQAHMEWTPSRLINWGNSIGPNTGILVERIMQKNKHPEQGYRSCLGLLSLAKRFPNERLEMACLRALTINSLSYRSVKSILEKGLDKVEIIEQDQLATPKHSNIRGSEYYQSRLLN